MLGLKIEELRKQKGLTQAELGKILGFQDSTVSQYETGKRTPDLRTIKILANFFGVSIDYLLEGTNYIKPEQDRTTPTTIAAHREDNPLSDLSPEARKSVEDYIEFARKKYPKKEDIEST